MTSQERKSTLRALRVTRKRLDDLIHELEASDKAERTQARQVDATVAVVLQRRAWNQEAIDDYQRGGGGTVAVGGMAARISLALGALLRQKAQEHGITLDEAWGRCRPFWRAWCNSPQVKYGPESFASNPRQVLPTVKPDLAEDADVKAFREGAK